jgi:hypothetical protein
MTATMTIHTPGSDELLALLGQPASSARVRHVLARLGMKPDFSEDPALALAAPAHGVSLRFDSPSERAPASSASGCGVPAQHDLSPMLVCVFFYAPGHEGHRGYSLPLPFGLDFGCSRARVRQLLGTPFRSSVRYQSDRWNFDGRYLALDFAKDEASMRLVTVGLPWRVHS